MKKIIALVLFNFSVIAAGLGQSANWSALLPTKFPTNASGQIHGISRVSQMKFHPSNPNKLYAVSARGGLFISSDGGANWAVAPGTDFMFSNRLASVCIDFTNDQILYLGTGDHDYYYNGTGVWKSTDGGQTFIQTALNNKMIVDMIMDPMDHNIIVAITNAGVYKTYNAGSTWTSKTTSIAFDDLKQKAVTGSRTLFASSTNAELYSSLDFGETWNQVTSGIYIPAGYASGGGCRIAVTPADTNVVYFAMVAKSGTIFKSTDGGMTFLAKKDTMPPFLTYYDNAATSSGQGDYNFGIGADRTNANILYLVAHNVWKSVDGGVTWTQLTNWYQKVHTDMHQVTVSPYNTTQLWNMNDGGVWLSVDGGNNWTPKSDGIYGYEIYHGNCSPTRRDMISIGTQDNGELYANSTGWFTNRGGDWSPSCAFDYRSSSSVVYYYNRNKRRDVGGSEVTYGLPANVTLLQDIAFHRSNSNLAFVGDSLIYRTTNLLSATPTWTQIASLGKKIMAMHSSFADPNRLYVITSDSKIYVSTDALSATPTFTMYAVPNATSTSASITSIKSAPNVIYITCNTRVYRSSDNGINWTNITYNLPAVNHVRIIADEFYSGTELVFIASDNAVYYKVASQASWTLYNLNFPSRTSIVDMNIYNDSTNNTVLRVHSYGRGVWETPISNLRALNSIFSADAMNPCIGTTVHFSDNSTGTVTSWNWQFPGGTPSYSTLQNPSVVYSVSGTYSVTLTVGNGISTSSSTRAGYISTLGQVLPLTEGFETSQFAPDGWTNKDVGSDGYTWQKSIVAGGFGTSSSSMFFDDYAQNSNGNRDDILTPRLDFSGYISAKLTFDIAYQPYSLTSYIDSFAVLISTDCGVTFNFIYLKWGSSLATVAGTNGSAFVPTASQWRKDTINLNAYVGQQSVIIVFENIGHYGNNLYIDNINISGVNVVTLNLKAFIGGFYRGSNTMAAVADPLGHPLLCDTITVRLASATPPYSIVQTTKTTIQTNGTITLTAPYSFYNHSYYLVLKHRNAIETWSSAPLSLSSENVFYDFTTAASKAYGNNQSSISGAWCLYSGDINQDGTVDILDMSIEDNDATLFVLGYSRSDLNGDGSSDILDMVIIDNNARLMLFVQSP